MQRFVITVVIAATLAAIINGVAPSTAQERTPPTANTGVANGYKPGVAILTWDAVPEAAYYRIAYVNMRRVCRRPWPTATGVRASCTLT